MSFKYLLKSTLTLLFALFIFISTPQSAFTVDCSRSPGGNATINSACTFPGAIDGVDAGSGTENTAVLLIASGGNLTVGVGQTLAVGSIDLTGGSIININGVIKLNTPLYMTDVDGDTYPNSTTTQYITSAAGRVRRNAIAAFTVDCDDNLYATNNICTFCGPSDTPATVGSDIYGTTCRKCVNNVAVDQTSSEDLFSQCTTAAPGSANSCKSPNCNGAGACGYLAAGENSQPACLTCNGASNDPVNITVNTQDTEGSNVCTAECMRCSAGACIAQTAAQDLFAHCPGAYACGGTLCNGAGACTPKAAGEQGLAACLRCDGTSLNAVNITVNTQDTEGSNVCTAECMKCSGGACIAQNSSQDLFAHCPGAYACGANLCNGSGACAADPAGETGLPACQRCNGTSLNAVNITVNTQDTEGSNLCTAECMKCSGGACIAQTAAQDLFAHCPGAYACAAGLCSGAGACTPKAAGEQGLAACLRCNGTSLNAVNITVNTQDTEGSNLCTATCKKCSGGACIIQTAAQDLFGQCSSNSCDNGLCSGTSAACQDGGTYTCDTCCTQRLTTNGCGNCANTTYSCVGYCWTGATCAPSGSCIYCPVYENCNCSCR